MLSSEYHNFNSSRALLVREQKKNYEREKKKKTVQTTYWMWWKRNECILMHVSFYFFISVAICSTRNFPLEKNIRQKCFENFVSERFFFPSKRMTAIWLWGSFDRKNVLFGFGKSLKWRNEERFMHRFRCLLFASCLFFLCLLFLSIFAKSSHPLASFVRRIESSICENKSSFRSCIDFWQSTTMTAKTHFCITRLPADAILNIIYIVINAIGICNHFYKGRYCPSFSVCVAFPLHSSSLLVDKIDRTRKWAEYEEIGAQKLTNEEVGIAGRKNNEVDFYFRQDAFWSRSNEHFFQLAHWTTTHYRHKMHGYVHFASTSAY